MNERGDWAEAVPILREGIEISRATGVGYIGASILGTLARATQDPEERDSVLSEGKNLLEQGCVSHNYFEYYCEAMELMLEQERWTDVETYAKSLEEFTKTEPLPRTVFFISRARCLAEFGAGSTGQDLVAKAKRLRDQAEEIGLKTAKQKLDRALTMSS